MTTDLYRRTITYDYGDEDRRQLMEKVWTVTPWMFDCFTGGINEERERKMREWLYENIGDQAHPIHGREGEWQFGGATIYGWTWIGFRTEDQLIRFKAEFPDAEKEE